MAMQRVMVRMMISLLKICCTKKKEEENLISGKATEIH